MANPYVPTNVRAENYTTISIQLDWDVSSVIEKNTKARYRVYGSLDDGATWNIVADNIIRSEASFKNEYSWYAVTSIHPTLGESAKSLPLKLIAPTSIADSNKRAAVGVDSDGNYHFLKVASDGGLILGEGIDISIDVTDLAKEAKQDDMINILEQIQANTDDMPYVSEVVASNVTPSGLTMTLPWKRASYIYQVLVLQEGGAATEFEVQILNNATATSEREIVTKMFSYGNARLDILGKIPYINRDSLDEIYIKIIPNTGTSNTYFIRLAGQLV